MVENRSGSIINISSIASLTPDYKQCAYGTSKAGINHLSKMIAIQMGKYNIRSNVVCPGMTETAAVSDNLPKEYQDKFFAATPLLRMASPEEIAEAVLYFASDESKFTTGQVMAIDGGYSLVPGTFSDDVGKAQIEK